MDGELGTLLSSGGPWAVFAALAVKWGFEAIKTRSLNGNTPFTRLQTAVESRGVEASRAHEKMSELIVAREDRMEGMLHELTAAVREQTVVLREWRDTERSQGR